ncbi:Fumarate hydratase class II [Poriferisphaera corsica]|uniref:Fumarate hydratase class II n=1 Tax=Poriferisphaera corsica TaxID=2528020 RepID=A0A517YVA2_9BACT|nr:class II fumarate hydratase [Poriferisphaera corsica]QDU34159.1 Fumarate hydratase class II [Poriferisphaera corsica]
MSETRIEKDSMGEMTVPADALYGASTARAVDNFPIANLPVPADVIHAFGHLKAACAQANKELGRLDAKIADVIIESANEVAEGKYDEHFPVDIYQTGSGTSTNMNGNEVIANIANDKLGFGVGAKGQEGAVHPNDHVNMGQSSNDTFPTGMHIAGALTISQNLIPGLKYLHAELAAKAKAWDGIVKIGRTHLMDATPIRVGQVFAGYARQVELGIDRATWALKEMLVNMPIGGTAVGTGINTHPDFAKKVCAALSAKLGVEFLEAEDHCEAQAAKDAFVSAHGHLKTIATSFTKIANDIRHLGSGPRCSIFELSLPAIQPGSSIMPGKVNPVICESMMQVACRVIGNDAAVNASALGGVGSIFELNVAMPVMIDAFLQSVTLLANVSNVFVDKLLKGLEVNEERCTELIDQSLMMCTSLAPEIGYDPAAALAKQAFKEGKTIRQLATEQKLVEPAKLAELLDPDKMTRPS